MNKKDLESLRSLLTQEKERLEQELAEIRSGNHEQVPSGAGGEAAYRTHMADSATETFERERDLSLEENVRNMLEGVTSALARVEKGTYGVCDVCGDPIAVERLKALPYADMCIECKKKEEAW